MTTQDAARTTTAIGPQPPAAGVEADESRYLQGLPAPSVLDRGRRRLTLASLRRPAAAAAEDPGGPSAPGPAVRA